jgi:hypothetical protein
MRKVEAHVGNCHGHKIAATYEMLLVLSAAADGALLALVKYPVSRSRISFPITTVLISVAVYLSRSIIANTLHAFRQATLVLVG